MLQTRPSVERVRPLKQFLNRLASVIVSPLALACALERRLGRSLSWFTFCGHLLALMPGAPGVFLRRAFYRWTLDHCAESVTIEFGAFFSRRSAVLERGAYIGAYTVIGSATIGENCLIGSRASVLSGGHQHELLSSGVWSATTERSLQRITVGANTWVGEGAILMADVGSGCMIAAGAVVSAPVPPHVMVAGNPARFVRRLRGDQPGATEDGDATVPSTS